MATAGKPPKRRAPNAAKLHVTKSVAENEPWTPEVRARMDAAREAGYAAQRKRRSILQTLVEDPATPPAVRVDAARELREAARQTKENTRARKRGADDGGIAPLAPVEIAELRKRVWRDFAQNEAPGGPLHNWYMEDRRRETDGAFLRQFRELCIDNLYVFAKFILGMRDLSAHLHRPVCEWLQDMSTTRRKLLMLPVVHLKTSIGSQAFPLHVIIQPRAGLYFPEWRGTDCRILLNGETEQKARENLSYIKQHLETNRFLRAMWPDCVWPSTNDAPLWKDEFITLPRTKIVGEPTITAIGVGSDLHGRHYDVIIGDDLATLKPAQSETLMNRARTHRKALRSRLDHPDNSIELGIGTHWTPTDIYVDWRKDPTVAVMIRSAIENGRPIWPERHSLESLERLQAEEGMGKVLFSANYMNNPLNTAFTALDWEECRQFWIEGDFAVAKADPRDLILEASTSLSALQRATHLRGESLRGMPLDKIYYDGRRMTPEEEEEQRTSRAVRFQRKLQQAEEGSGEWVKLSEMAARHGWATRQPLPPR